MAKHLTPIRRTGRSCRSLRPALTSQRQCCEATCHCQEAEGNYSSFRNQAARVIYPDLMGSGNPMTRHDWFILVTMVGLPLCLFLYALAALYADLDKVIIKFW
jgi:hypothetical protein